MVLTVLGPWKKKCLMTFGIRNQCIAKNKVDETYLANVMLKINAKVWDTNRFFTYMLITHKNSKSLVVLQLGGLNSMLSAEVSQTIPLVSKVPTMILAMGLTHAPSSRSDLPSVAAVSPIIVTVWFGKAILHSQVFCNFILISPYLCIRWSVLDSGR